MVSIPMKFMIMAFILINTFLEEEGERILLYTCYPINGVGYRYQRYVVFAKKIEGKDL